MRRFRAGIIAAATVGVHHAVARVLTTFAGADPRARIVDRFAITIDLAHYTRSVHVSDRPSEFWMKDHQLRAFSTVARLGTVRAAARELHLSQSALTKALRELEEALGGALLVRSHKGVSLTEGGQALLARVELASAQLELGRAEVQALSGGGGPSVSVGVTPVTAMATLAPVWKTLRQRLPRVSAPVEF